MSRFAYIYNPAARFGKTGNKLRKLKRYVRDQPDADFYRSKKKGDISTLVSDLLSEYDVFVACGGDGTVREVAEVLINTDKLLGIIPLGTGNDLCKTLGIPVELDRSLSVVRQQEATPIDVGRCGSSIFLNSLGFGFDGLTNRLAYESQSLPAFLRYATAAIKAALRQAPFGVHIKREGGAAKKELLMISFANGRIEGGSFWIAPEASITDGKLDMVTISPLNRWLIPVLLPLILFRKGHWIPQLATQKVKSVTLQFEGEIDIHADGEIIRTDRQMFEIGIMPKALNVICGL